LIAKDAEGRVCGQVRYRNEGCFATVSVSLSTQVRGGGEARKLLAQGDLRCLARWPGVQYIEAEVSPENEASLKSFERVGYQKQMIQREHAGSVYQVYWKGWTHV